MLVNSLKFGIFLLIHLTDSFDCSNMSRRMLVADANLDQTNLEETLLMDTSLSGNRSVQEQGEDRDVSALTALSAESIAEEEEEEETFMDATVNGLDETGQ